MGPVLNTFSYWPYWAENITVFYPSYSSQYFRILKWIISEHFTNKESFTLMKANRLYWQEDCHRTMGYSPSMRSSQTTAMEENRVAQMGHSFSNPLDTLNNDEVKWKQKSSPTQSDWSGPVPVLSGFVRSSNARRSDGDAVIWSMCSPGTLKTYQAVFKCQTNWHSVAVWAWQWHQSKIPLTSQGACQKRNRYFLKMTPLRVVLVTAVEWANLAIGVTSDLWPPLAERIFLTLGCGWSIQLHLNLKQINHWTCNDATERHDHIWRNP